MDVEIGDGLSREERETIIVFDDAGGTARITTASPTMARKLSALCLEQGIPVETRSAWCVTACVPRSWLKLSPPRRMTAEQRARQAAILADARQRRQAALATT